MDAGRVARFVVVGAINTANYYGCYLLLRLVLPYLVAHMLAFGIAMVGSYFLSCYVTFRTRPRLRTFLLFPLSNVTNFAITTVGLHVMVRWVGMDERIAPVPVALVSIPVTYLVTHYIMLGHVRDPYREEVAHELAVREET